MVANVPPREASDRLIIFQVGLHGNFRDIKEIYRRRDDIMFNVLILILSPGFEPWPRLFSVFESSCCVLGPDDLFLR